MGADRKWKCQENNASCTFENKYCLMINSLKISYSQYTSSTLYLYSTQLHQVHSYLPILINFMSSFILIKSNLGCPYNSLCGAIHLRLSTEEGAYF